MLQQLQAKQGDTLRLRRLGNGRARLHVSLLRDAHDQHSDSNCAPAAAAPASASKASSAGAQLEAQKQAPDIRELEKEVRVRARSARSERARVACMQLEHL